MVYWQSTPLWIRVYSSSEVVRSLSPPTIWRDIRDYRTFSLVILVIILAHNPYFPNSSQKSYEKSVIVKNKRGDDGWSVIHYILGKKKCITIIVCILMAISNKVVPCKKKIQKDDTFAFLISVASHKRQHVQIWYFKYNTLGLIKLTFISSFKFKLMTVAAVSCSGSDSNVKYILGGWLQACDYNTGRLGSGGGIAELFMFLEKEKKKTEKQI